MQCSVLSGIRARSWNWLLVIESSQYVCTWEGITKLPPLSAVAAAPSVTMGVPKLARWMCDRYPTLLEHVVTSEDGTFLRLNVGHHHSNRAGDTSSLSRRYDNLYIDLNGIIHGATVASVRIKLCIALLGQRRGRGARFSVVIDLIAMLVQDTSDDAVAAAVFKEINAAVHLARPTSLLYLAADGVAPLAKKQRTGRFAHAVAARAARADVEATVLAAGGSAADAEEAAAAVFDKNAISPGTAFMQGLEDRIRAHVALKLESDDAAWSGLRVVFSGHTVPGEGEVRL